MGKDSERGNYTSPEGSRTWEYLSAVFCAMGMFCIGNAMGWNSPSLSGLSAPDSRIPITPGEASTLTACVSMGHIVSMPLSVLTVDRIGRKNSILASTVPMIISWGMILIAESVMVLYVARMIAGISVGLIISTCQMYTAEILSAKIRGSLAATGGITTYSGVLFMFAAGPHLGLRVMAVCCIAFTAIFFICFWFIPESPYFLVMVGRVEEAETALEKLRGKTDVAEELELIKATLREKGKSLLKTEESENEVGARKPSALKLLFTIRGNLKSFFIGLVLTTIQHFCGSLMILYYCHMILTDMGTSFDVYLASMIFNILQILSAGSHVLVVDRFGRRPLLLISGVVSSFLLTIIATYFYLMEHTDFDVSQYSMVPLYSVFALVVALGMGVMSVTGTIQSEIFAIDVKILAFSIVSFCGSLMTISSAKVYLLMATTWGYGHSIPFFGFAAITFFCTVILMRWLPETKGKTLLQIQKELND